VRVLDSGALSGNVYLFGPIAAGSDVLTDDYDGVEADPNGADP